MLRGLSVCVLSAGRVGTGDCVCVSVMLVFCVLMIEQCWAVLGFFGAVLSCIVDCRAVLVHIISSEDGWSRSEAVVGTVGGRYMESHAAESYTRRLYGRMVCAASVRMCACRLRACVRGIRWRGYGRGGRWACMSESEKVAWKFQRACQRLLEDVQHIIEMSSSCRSCSQWFTRPKSWPKRMSSTCEVVGE